MGRYAGIATVGAVILSLGAGGCGQAVPSESDAAKIVRPYLAQFGETLDFRKTNGQQRELLGVKAYIVFVRGAAKLQSGFYAIKGFGGLQDVRRAKAGFLEQDTALPAGTIYVIEGEVVFTLTEKGWKHDSWNRTRFGYCPTAKSARECYDALKWDS